MCPVISVTMERRCHISIGLLCILVQCAVGQVNLPAEILITSMPDGLFVSGGHSLRAQAAEWTVLVTVEKVRTPAHLEMDLQHVQDIIHLPNVSEWLTDEARKAWQGRLDYLRRMFEWDSKVQSSTAVRRVKRGAFDFGGKILSSLFGLATQKDIERCQKLVQQVRHRDNRVIHFINDLVSIINKTSKELSDNRQRINLMRVYLIKLHDQVQQIRKLSVHLQRKLHYVDLSTKLEMIFEMLEKEVQFYRLMHNHFNKQILAVEAGRLTRELLPVNDLRSIVHQARGSKLHAIEDLEWYYRFTEVELISVDDVTLIYRIKIPLADGHHYLHYSINSWPVPYTASKYSVQVDFTGSVGLDTVSGQIFLPQYCKGHSPMVCHKGALYSNGHYQCPRGIILGDRSSRDQCVTTVRKNHGAESLIHEVFPGDFVIISWGEKCVLRCEGQRETPFHLQAGCYRVSLLGGCVLSGEGWSIEGLHEKLVNFSIWAQQLPDMIPFNITSQIPKDWAIKQLKFPAWDAMGAISKVKLDEFDDNDVNSWSEEDSLASQAWGVSGVSLLISLFIVVVLSVCARALWLKFKCTTKPESKETAALPLRIADGPIVDDARTDGALDRES